MSITQIPKLRLLKKSRGLKKTFITFIVGAEATYNINRRMSIGIKSNDPLFINARKPGNTC